MAILDIWRGLVRLLNSEQKPATSATEKLKKPLIWDRPAQWLNESTSFHYAWVIVSILAMVQIIGLSVNFAGGVLVYPLSDPDGQFAFKMTDIGISYGMFYLAGAAMAPVAGWLGDRFGARRLMIAGAGIYALTIFSVAVMDWNPCNSP